MLDGDPSGSWSCSILGISFYKEEFIPILISSDKVKDKYFHLAEPFIDDRFSINVGGEFRKSISGISKRTQALGWTLQLVMMVF